MISQGSIGSAVPATTIRRGSKHRPRCCQNCLRHSSHHPTTPTLPACGHGLDHGHGLCHVLCHGPCCDRARFHGRGQLHGRAACWLRISESTSVQTAQIGILTATVPLYCCTTLQRAIRKQASRGSVRCSVSFWGRSGPWATLAHVCRWAFCWLYTLGRGTPKPSALPNSRGKISFNQ